MKQLSSMQTLIAIIISFLRKKKIKPVRVELVISWINLESEFVIRRHMRLMFTSFRISQFCCRKQKIEIWYNVNEILLIFLMYDIAN